MPRTVPFTFTFFLSVASIVFTGCQSTPKSLELEHSSLVLTKADEVAELKVRVFGQDGKALTDAAVDYTIENPEVAAVTKEGIVTPLSSGTTQILAKIGEIEEKIPLRVSLPAHIEFSLPQVTLTSELPTIQVNARLYDEKGDPWPGQAAFTWNSTDPNIVSVTDGNMSAHKTGTTLITASAGALHAEIPATVLLEEISLNTR